MIYIEYEVRFSNWLNAVTFAGLFQSRAEFNRLTPLNFQQRGYVSHRILQVRGTEDER